ncbi:MAG: hypothetical protein NC311_10985 [Muribaculaceae bacterium]|nr:hypothetical protein [Muribaculaceae bacterium]
MASLLPDAVYLRLKFRKNFGRWPNLKNPKTFNEKLNWLKLHDRNPLYTRMVDKYEAKQYVASIIGEEYIIPTYGVWDRAEDIDFDSLPDKFVLKATHDSGRVIICKDKSKLDKKKAIGEMRESLHRNFYAVTREWPYKNVKPRIIAEQLLEASDDVELADYKVHNFNGTPKVILVCRDRFKETGLTEDFFDTEWKHIDVRRPGHPNASTLEKCPESLAKMLDLSEKLSKDYPFMRTDFYTIGGKVFFGEITLYPASGSVPFDPNNYDDVMGEWLVAEGGGNLLIINNICLFIHESYITNDIRDYKFFCFNGQVEFMKVDFDRQMNHGANYYDKNFNLLELNELEYPRNPQKRIERPKNFELMIELAEKIANEHKFLRVDFYEVNGKVYFGETTFYPASGMGNLGPDNADLEIGKLIDLDSVCS